MISKSINLKNINKKFNSVEVIKSFNLKINEGEFVTLLGPSGCGKTTLLRMIAGLEHVSSGEIFIGDENVTSVPPNKRDTSIMFQDYALFPHMNIEQNIGYGLKLKKLDKNLIKEKTSSWLKKIGLENYNNRMPYEISGGQRQRVALARSLIVEPGVLLLDEPLGALDANLRKTMQVELKKIHSEFGITFVYVTHDQEEALSMSSRIVLMNEGEIEQLSNPNELYDKPNTSFAAKFMGFSNIYSISDLQQLNSENIIKHLKEEHINLNKICFRSKDIEIHPQKNGEFKIISKNYYGDLYKFQAINSNGLIINLSSSDNKISKLEINSEVNLTIDNSKIISLQK